MDPMVIAALIQAGSGLLGSGISGIGAQRQGQQARADMLRQEGEDKRQFGLQFGLNRAGMMQDAATGGLNFLRDNYAMAQQNAARYGLRNAMRGL